MGATVIVLDTNQFRSSPMLRSSDWNQLIEKAAEWGLQFAVPKVCFMEAVSVVRRKWREQQVEIARLAVGEFGLQESQSEWLAEIENKIDGYEEALRKRLAEIGAAIVQIPETVGVDDLVQRAIDRRRPNPEGEGKKDGFRDTLIWLTTQRIAADDGECEVWLISTNHNDFGNKSEAEGDESCPYPLHPHLVEDLDTNGLSGRVLYVRTIGRLVQHLAGTYDELSAEERRSLIEQLDESDLQRALFDALHRRLIDPAAAALPVRTIEASINSFSCLPENLQFVDAAMRGGGAWTAQFNQTIDASVDLTEMSGDTTTLDKTLEVAGRLVAGANGTVSELIVTSIEAQQDDPMRRAWDRPAPEWQMVHDYLRQMPSTSDAIRKQMQDMPPIADTIRKQMQDMPPIADTIRKQMQDMPPIGGLGRTSKPKGTSDKDPRVEPDQSPTDAHGDEPDSESEPDEQ